MPDKIDKLYEALKADGAVNKSRENFRSYMLASGEQGYKNRKQLFDALKADGAVSSATYEEFRDRLGLHAVKPKQGGTARVSQPTGQVAAKPKVQGGAQMTEAQKQQALQGVSGLLSKTQQSIQQTRNKIDFAKGNSGLGVKPVKLGQNRKVVEKQTINPTSGKIEQHYLTEAGNEYDSRGIADLEQHQIDDAKERELNPIETELRDAYTERDRLNQLAQERIDELEREYEDRPWYTKIGEYANSDKIPDAGAPMHRWDNDAQYKQYMAALRKNNALITTLEDKKSGRMNEFWHTLGNEITNGYTFSLGGKAQLDDMGALVEAQKHVDSINKKRQKGEVLTKEEEAAEAVLKNAEWDNRVQSQYGDEYGAWARAGKMGAVSADLMMDFALMGGNPLSLAKSIAGGTSKLATEFGGKALTKGFGKYMVKATGATLGSMVAGAEIANTVGFGRTMTDAANRYQGDILLDENGDYVFGRLEDDGKGGQKLVKGGNSFLGAVLGAERTAIAENGSEIAGAFLPGGKVLLKGMEKIGLSKIASGLTSLSGKQWYGAYSKALETAGFNGVPGEALEEYVGTGFDALMGGDEWKNLADKRTHVDIWLGCATMGALLNAPRMVGTGYQMAQYYRYKHNTDKSDRLAGARLGNDVWEPLRQQIDEATNGQITDVLVGILDNESLNKEQKRVVAEYAVNLQRMRGYSLGRVSTEERNDEHQPTQQELEEQRLEQSYTQGYGSTDTNDMQDAKYAVEAARERLISEIDEQTAEDLDNDPFGTLRRLSPTQWTRALDYINAKAAYDGMIQRVRDGIDSQVEESNNTINQRTNKADGQLHPVDTKYFGKVFIVDGQVAMLPDGTMVDKEKSDQDIIVIDEQGKTRFIPAEDILSVDEPISAEEESQRLAEEIRQSVAQEAANKIDGTLPFRQGDTYEVVDEEGTQHTVDVVQDLGDGTVTTLIDGQIVTTPVSKEQIQSWADNAARIRREQKEAEEQPQGETPVEEAPATAETETSPEETPATTEETPATAETETPTEEAPATTEEAQPTEENSQEPMPMVEVKGKQKPDWSNASPARAHAYIYNERGLSRENANAFVENNRKAAEDELKKLQKKQPKMGTDLDEFDEKNAAWQQQVDAVQQRMDYWSAVKQEQDKIAAAEQAERAQREQQTLAEARAQEQQRQQEELAKQAEQEALGSNKPSPAITEKWQKARKIYGRSETIVLPNGERVKGKWVLHESGASTPSHNPFTWEPTEGFPEDKYGNTTNDRDYRGDKDAQKHVVNISRNLDKRAWQTPVMVTEEDGITMSGNGRTEARELAAANGTDQQYIADLKEEAGKFNFTEEDVNSFEHPTLSFEIEGKMPYTTETFAKFNQQEMKGQSKTEQAVKLGKVVDDSTFNRIIRSINNFDTLGEFYADTNAATEAISELQKIGVISQAQYTEMFDGDAVSEAGRQMLENMLIGKAFESNPDAVRQLTEVKSLRQNIVNALAEVSSNLQLGEDYNLESELAQAIELAYRARKSGFKLGDKVSGFARQQNLFQFDEGATVADYTNMTILMLADAINGSYRDAKDKLISFKKILSHYNNQAADSAAGQADIFSGGVKTKEDILREVLEILGYGKELKKQAANTTAVEQPRSGESAQQDGATPAVNTDGEATVEPSAEPAPAEAEPNAVQAALAEAEQETNTEPTEAQKEAGNYKKGHVKIDGYDVTIENPKGSVRRGTDASGKQWEQEMQNTYGYIRGTEGVDGDHIDVFFSDDPSQGDVFVVDQVNKDGSFDEHKVMYGFPDIESARKAYLSNYEDGWQGLGAITPVSKEEFKKWIDSSHRKTKPFAEYSSVKPLGDTQVGEQPNAGYSIEQTTYTNKKGKTTPMHLVTFGRELSKDEIRAGKELAKESRGWWDREKNGFMMRSEDSAKALAEALSNEEAVQDAQPLSVEDVAAVTDQADMKAVDEAIKVEQEPQTTPQYDYDREDDVYDKTLTGLRNVLNDRKRGAIPNIKSIENIIRDLRKRAKTIEDGMATAAGETIPQAFDALANLNGRRKAYEQFLVDIRKRMAEDERDDALAAHGVKIGDKVKIRGKEATIHDADARQVTLDVGLAPVLYEVADWENVELPKREPATQQPEKVNADEVQGAAPVEPQTGEGDVMGISVPGELRSLFTDEVAEVYVNDSKRNALAGIGVSPSLYGNQGALKKRLQELNRELDALRNKPDKTGDDFADYFTKLGEAQAYEEAIKRYFGDEGSDAGEKPQQEKKSSEQTKPKVTLGFKTRNPAAKDKLRAVRTFQNEFDNITHKKRGYANQYKRFEEYRKKYGWKKFEDFDLYAIIDNNGNFIDFSDSPRGAYDIALNNDLESFMVVRQQPTDEGFEYNATHGWLFTNDIPDSEWYDDNGALREEVKQKATFAIANELPDAKMSQTMSALVDRDWKVNLERAVGQFSNLIADNKERNGKEFAEIIGNNRENDLYTKIAQKVIEEHLISIKVRPDGRIMDLKVSDDKLQGQPEATTETTAEQPKQEQKKAKSKWVDDADAERFEKLRKRLRMKLGGQLNMGLDPEAFAIGVEMSYLMLKHGARKFGEFAKNLIEALGEEIRPYVKTLYNGARDLPEMADIEKDMTPWDEVRSFDIMNFDKEGAKDIVATAEHIVREQAAEREAKEATDKLKQERNEQRKETEQEVAANTEALASEAATVASEVESKLPSARSEREVNDLAKDIDNAIDKVNDQLALLGYYEAEPVEKDFNEAYGYMRNAEKKAVKNVTELFKTLTKELGISDPVVYDTKGKKQKSVTANIAPAGGDVTMRFMLNRDKGVELYINFTLEPDYENNRDNLVLKGIMFRPEKNLPNGARDYLRANNFFPVDVTVPQMLQGIRSVCQEWLPAKDDVAMTQSAAAENAGNQKKNTSKGGKSKKKSVSLQQQTIPDLFSGLFGEEDNNLKPTSNEQEVHVQPRTGTSEREGGHQRGQNEPLGESKQNEDERPDTGRVAGRSGSDIKSDTAGGSRVSKLSDGKRNIKPAKPEPAPLAESERKNTHNNHVERGTDYAPKGTSARIAANIKAIETMQRLIESGEPATPEDMSVLRKFSGWGGLAAAFKERDGWNENPVNKRLRELLSSEAYEAANMSRNTAYYTPAPIIDAMWDVARAMGFRGGSVLEGSAGIGKVLGLMPTDMSERSDIHAVEIDETTGNILKLLYPDANVEVKGFEKTFVPNGSVDLAITNVPFGDILVKDDTGDKDLSKKFHSIHDFCIAKNVRKLKEGGIGIFISTSGTLDSPNSAKLRNWLVNEGNADVVGAFRMNNETFGGAGVTSDIIVVRKRVNGRKSANAIDVSGTLPIRTVKYDTGETKRGSSEAVVKDLALDINKHFVEHPEDMAGEMAFAFEKGSTYRATSKACYPSPSINQEQRLSEWAQQFKDMDWDKAEEREIQQVVYEDLGEDVKEGSMLLDSDGNLCLAQRGKAVPINVNANKVKGHTKAECFNAYKAIKDALADVLEYQTTHSDDSGLQQRLAKLNKAYDSFVKTYGHLNKNTSISFLRNDMDYPSIAALESVSETGDKSGKRIVTYGKTDIFSRRVVETESEPKPTTIKDGIIASIYLNGRVDVPYIAEQLNMSDSDVRQQIIESGLGFENPTTTEMEVSYEYLSGNVREKLRQAQENNTDGRYDANIKALERVIPMNIPAHLIEFTLGSSWVEPKLYEDYVKERTGLDVKLTNAGGTWIMNEPYWTDTEQNKAMGVISEKCDKTILGHELIKAAITCKTISVTKTITTGYGSNKTTETIVDKEATMACANKIDEIRQDFKDWARGKMQSDPEMSERMERVYNDLFNNSVPKEIPDEFVPEHFGGAATVVNGKPFKLRPHQAKAVIRATTQPLMLAHEVGTGKTYTLISTAMEMRRLGTARKPMIVVQNATVGQFVASAKALYPNAKILTLEDADRNAEGRRNFYAKIRYNDWDMIVVPQSVFERIPDSEERQIRFVEDKVEEKMIVLEKMREATADDRDPVLRQAQRELDQLNDELNNLKLALQERKAGGKTEKDEKREAKTRQNAMVKAQEMLDRETDDVANFDDMGIDALLIDEAHEYKHLGFATAMQRGVKGVDPSYSKKSQGVYLKTQAVLENKNGKNVVFATGTPISNTAAEIWTFMRYLMPADTMREYGIYYFDDFVRNFGNIQQMLEHSTNGKYKENNRFAGYVNLPELVRIWSTVADTVLTREAGGVSDKIPKMNGGKAQDIYLPQTKALRGIIKYVKEQLDEYEKMSGKQKKENSHIPLVMYGIAKAAAVDARLVLEDAADEPNSKTNEAVRQTLRSLEESKEYNGTVAIFADNYQNKATGFNLYEDIRKKLIDAGVPEEQVVVMKSGMSIKKKLEIFDKVNRGEVRVIMGSTFTLGTGVNIQERLHTLIHVDAPNRPMDYTQRNGRILRQGNLHNEWGIPVHVLRFGVEDSLDVTAYQRLKTKGAIADSIMEGKKMLSNSMENRVMEEDQDLFGDITAQLSGSQYALLKNQVEKEVRKLEARKKQWEADQTYVHNQKPRLKALIKDSEERAERNKEALTKVKAAKNDGITIGKTKFPSLDAMGDYIKDYNSKQREQQEQVRTASNYQAEAKSDLTVNVGGFDFNIHRVITKEQKQEKGQLSLSFYSKTQMTYSCPELGLEGVPVEGQRLKSALEDIVNNVMTGNDFREKAENAERAAERYKGELQQVEARDGKPFDYADELKQAKEKLAEYEELMKAEMAEKEAKYAEMDASVEAAKGVQLSDEDSNDADEDTARYRIRENEPPTKTGIGYKVFVLKDGKLYPPMVANPNGEATPVGVWLDADAAPVAGVTKTGRQQVKAGGKGTQGGSGKLAYRPGWHLGEIPYALQFNRINPETGQRELFPANFVWAEVEYADDVDYNEEARSYGMNANGKYQHSLAGLPRVPENGSYRYRTNPDPNTDPWIITGAMRVKRVLTPSEVDQIVEDAGREPQERQAGAVTDEQVNALNAEIERTMQEDADMKRTTAEQIGEKLNIKLNIIEDVDDITHPNTEVQERRRRSKGWYDTATGEVYIVLPNNADVDDVKATIGHETVAHKGLRELIGEEHYNDFLDETYSHLRDDLKQQVDGEAGKMFLSAINAQQAGRTYEECRRTAVDELFGRLAEKPFEEFSEGERTLWQKIKDTVRRLLDKFLGSLKLPKSFELGDNELRYILWRSKERLERGREHPIDLARDIVKREELGLTEENTDLYREDGEVEEYDAGRKSLSESLTEGLIALANKNRDNLTLRINAMRAIGGNLSKLRQAMARQREYDKETVNNIVRWARVLMNAGYGGEMTKGEVSRLIGMIGQAAAREDITKQANAIMDLMITHNLRACKEILSKQLRVKGSKLNSSGVEVQAGLDIEGQRMVGAFKDAMALTEDALAARIEDTLDRMGSSDKVIADNAAADYQGLLLAQQYLENIKKSEVEEKTLKQELKTAKEDYKAGNLSHQEYKEYVASIENALRENKLDRIEAYGQLVSAMGDGMRESVERAKEWRESEKQRVNEIHHNANSDLNGVSTSENEKLSWWQKANNWSLVRFFAKPLATFDYMLRFFGSKSVDGRGYLFNRFMGGWTKAADREWRNLKAAHNELDDKVSEVMGKEMRWSDLFDIERKMPTVPVEIWDAGEKRNVELTQGNLLYIYMVNKMSDGKMKLRRMGITEEDVDYITEQIDPRFKEIADWVQEEFLTKKREEYNKVYERMFGSSMAAIDNYFPLKINSRSRGQEEDIGSASYAEDKPATITGSVIKRTRNSLPLDLLGADAFDVVLEHLQDMEHWAAFAEFSRDLNTLLSYRRFKNRVLNMSSTRYGAGEILWKNFKDVCAIAAGTYQPIANRNSLDKAAVNVAKGVTAAKISLRIYTALKQLLSYPAYFSEANVLEMAKSTNPIGAVKAWNWAIEELPGFAERWESRQAGDSRLKETDNDWSVWKNKIVEIASRWGMSPNAFVDGLTVAMGAKAIYETKYKKYKKMGYPAEKAKDKALQDASMVYNETQQSSGNAYLSAMQVDRTLGSVALTVFRNASMGYERRMVQALSNLKSKMRPGYRQQTIEFMTKEMMRDGLTEEQAKENAERMYKRSWFKDVADTIIFGFVLQAAWNLGPYLPYLLAGDDDDEKDSMLSDALWHALAGGIEGLSGGNLMSDLYNNARNGTGWRNFNLNLLPLMSDIQNTVRKFDNNAVAGWNEVFNIIIQSGVGVNPQTITDAMVAIMDYTNGNPEEGREIAMLMMRLLQIPQSSLDKLYIDELQMSARDAKKLDVQTLAKRYIDYKRKKEAPLTDWAYSDEMRQKVDDKYSKRFENLLKERIEQFDDEKLQQYYDTADPVLKKTIGKEVAKRLGGTDSYGNPSTDYGDTYLRMRDYIDLAEDILLQSEGAKAEQAGDTERAEDISAARNAITAIKKELAEATSEEERQQIMQDLREERKEWLNDLNITHVNK